MNIHIMNQHMPKEVYEHLGKDLIRIHKHFIQGTIAKKKGGMKVISNNVHLPTILRTVS